MHTEEREGGTVVPIIPIFCTGLNYNIIDVISALHFLMLYESCIIQM